MTLCRKSGINVYKVRDITQSDKWLDFESVGKKSCEGNLLLDTAVGYLDVYCVHVYLRAVFLRLAYHESFPSFMRLQLCYVNGITYGKNVTW